MTAGLVSAELAAPFALTPFALTPFDDLEFRDGLQLLRGSVEDGWRRWAAECRVIARLAAQVPRTRFDERGPTAWTSFLRAIAVARRCSDQAAHKEVLISVALVAAHPRALAHLEDGQLPQYNARVLVEECLGLDRAVIEAVDDELADRACRLTPSRIRDAVRKIELRYDGDAAAVREAKAARARGVRLVPQRDGQADLIISGPALPLVRLYDRLTAEARAARAAGDDRPLDALRFEAAVDGPGVAADEAGADVAAVDEPGAASDRTAAVRSTDVAPSDRRCTRPIQASLQVPVTTALGLSNEPGWLDGYGWISAPQCREWLTLAELRQVCVSESGQVVDVADRLIRPETTPQGVRDAVLAMVDRPGAISPKTYREEAQHDPSPGLARFVNVRDVVCDGPTGRRVRAVHCDHDHELRHPDGPTAAWNLVNRSRRTHVLKHRGWTPLRTATSTLWFTPAGQVVEVPHALSPPPSLETEATLPDAADLHHVDAELCAEPFDDVPFDAPPF